jgi:prepilin-type N-terminal cleavage/methylation domain-containing protein
MKITVVNKTQKGFTILELLISVIVFLIAIAAIFGVLRIGAIQKNTTSNRTDQLRSARIALEYIRRDTLNAGLGYHRTGGNVPDDFGYSLFGFPKDADSERDLLVSIFAGNDLTNNILNPGKKMDMIGFVSRNQTFNGGNLVNFTSTNNTGDVVYVTTANGGATNCSINDLYIIESDSGTTQVIGMATAVSGNNKITLAKTDALKVNQSATAAGENLNLLMTTSGSGSIKKIDLISYGITADGVLVRKSFGNQGTAANQIEQRELVYGVSDFQIKYFMEDGTTVEDPSSNNNGRSNQIKMNSVVQVQISITVLPTEQPGQQAPVSPVTVKEFISTKNLRYEAS